VKSVNQLRIVLPEPANATMIRDLVGSSATKPLMFAVVMSLLLGLESGERRGGGEAYEPPNSTRDVTLSASTRAQALTGQVIRDSEAEFSFL
jgi:hypothetical protein